MENKGAWRWKRGAITISSNGVDWTINDGSVTLEKLSATGTRDSTKFLRGDDTWAVPAVSAMSGTIAEFNAALTDGDFATGGGTATGANTGDQTSIVGITGTIAQFNTALSDADFATGGGTATGTNTGDHSLTNFSQFHDCDSTAGLTVSGGSITYDGATGHPGMIVITSAAAQYSQARFSWGASATARPFNIDDFQRVTWIFKYDSVADIQGWFGLCGGTGGATGDQSQTASIISFISNSALTFRVNNAATSSATTSVTIAANTWYKFDIVRNSATSVSLWVNDVLAATVTTGVPSGSICGIHGRLMTLANPGAKVWTMDAVHPQFTTSALRY